MPTSSAPHRGNGRDDALGVLREDDGLSSAPGNELSFEPLRASGTDDLMMRTSAFDAFDFNLDDSESMMSPRNSFQPGGGVGNFAARMFNGSGGSGSSMLMDDADAALEMSLNSMGSLCLDGSLRGSTASAMLASSTRSTTDNSNGTASAMGNDDSNNERKQRPQHLPPHPQRGEADDAIAEARAVLAGQLHDDNNDSGSGSGRKSSSRIINNNNDKKKNGGPSEERRRPTSRRNAQQNNDGHRLANSGTRIINNVNLDPDVPSGGGPRRSRSMNLGGTTLVGLEGAPTMDENNEGNDRVGDLARFIQRQQQQEQQKAGALLGDMMASRRQSDPGEALRSSEERSRGSGGVAGFQSLQRQ